MLPKMTEELPEKTGIRKGTVKWFDDKKGYGFIEEPGGTDIFVHFSSIDSKGYRSLTEGMLVEYQLDEEQGARKGPRAKNVRVRGDGKAPKKRRH